jgi:uncharacterized metal-binding protein
MKCALCISKECYEGKDCTDGDIIEKARELYSGEHFVMLEKAALIEARHYMEKTRLEELILFVKEMEYNKLGLAFCIGLEDEAKRVHRILEKHFEVHSVCCKVCGMDKEEHKLEKLHGEGFEASCNPISQALVLNDENTDLNIILGLCMGHDILFTEHSEAPVTTLAVKDRVLTHNPLGAVYSKYYLENRFGLTDK